MDLYMAIYKAYCFMHRWQSHIGSKIHLYPNIGNDLVMFIVGFKSDRLTCWPSCCAKRVPIARSPPIPRHRLPYPRKCGLIKYPVNKYPRMDVFFKLWSFGHAETLPRHRHWHHVCQLVGMCRHAIYNQELEKNMNGDLASRDRFTYSFCVFAEDLYCRMPPV